MPCGLSLSQQRSKQHKLELWKGLTGGQSEKRAFGDFWTAYIVEAGHYYYIVSLVNCSRINSYVGIHIWSYPSAGVNSAIFAYYFDLFNSL